MAISNEKFIQALASATDISFGGRIPSTTQASVNDIAEVVTTYPSAKNEFLNVLTNQIGLQKFSNKVYTNPYKLFHQGALPYGTSVENIFVDIIKGKDFTDKGTNSSIDDANELLATVSPNVKIEYYTENFRHQYKVTVSDERLKSAFRQQNGLSTLTGMILTSPLNSAEYDEYLMVKKSLQYVEGATHEIKSSDWDALSGKEKASELTKIIREYAIKFRLMSNKYNKQGVTTFTNPQDLVVFVDAETRANIDVELLSQAFHIDKADIDYHVLVVDEFNEPGVLCQLMDKDAIQIWDTLSSTETFRNPRSLSTHCFYNKWGLFSANKFSNSIKIKSVETLTE